MAEPTTMLSAVTATGASSAFDVSQADKVFIQVYSASTSTATVAIQQSNSASGPWYASTGTSVITDPTSTGEMWDVPATNWVRVNVLTRSAGFITATISAFRGATQIQFPISSS